MRRARRAGAIAGFTVLEALIALVVLTVVAASIVRTTQQVAHFVQRSRLELGATAFLMTEASRLRRLPWDSLASGSRTRADSVATWTVSDSAGVRRILLVTGYTSPTTGALAVWDSILVVRRSPP